MFKKLDYWNKMEGTVCEEDDWQNILEKKCLGWFSGDRSTVPSLLVRALLYRRDHRAVQGTVTWSN